jgi:integrase
MASISRDANGRRTIQFVGADGKRRSIRLGKVSQKTAEQVQSKVEKLNAAILSGFAPDDDTARWLAEIGDTLAAKLAAVGLIQARETARLGEFIDGYIVQRTDAKPSTITNLKVAGARLVEFFGRDKCLRDVTPGDVDSWLLSLKNRYADATTGRTLKRAKQFFRVALRRKLISENPFAEVKGLSEANESRKVFISQEDARKVLTACPNAEWRLLFALSRFGGLRCPSEHLALELADVDWERDRIRIRSTKTGNRFVPIFPELRPHLLEVCKAAEPGTVYVINRYRSPNINLRTQFLRIIRRAGLTPWTKPFHNLRATRETELAAEYPIHVVCAWIGNTARIAQKHYLQVPDDYFERAAKSGAVVVQNPVQQPAAPVRTGVQESSEGKAGYGVVPAGATGCEMTRNQRAPRVGLEPTTNRLTGALLTPPKSPEKPVIFAEYHRFTWIASGCIALRGVASVFGISAPMRGIFRAI